MSLPPTLGSYQPLLKLASGGMATVYAVRMSGARGFERIVVMKRVHPHLLDNQGFRAMFLDEARISSLVKHPNIVPVIDVVEDKDELFLIMEYVESVSLAQLLHTLKETRLPPSIAARITSDVLAGLHAAHEAVDLRGQPMSIIHRDVSPQNVIIGTDGTSRLIDFGIAKAASRLTSTTTGSLKGKFGYMAPEQLRQQDVDRRADLFSAGVVLHETLTGKRLFAAGDEADALLSVLIREIPDPSSLAADVAPGLDAVVHQALSRDREARFATATEFATALESACPPATHREVAALVARACTEALETRRRELRSALDTVAPPPSPSLAPPVAVAPGASVGAPAYAPVDVVVDTTLADPTVSPSRRRLIVALGLGGAAAASLLVFELARPPSSTQAEPATVAPSSAPSSSVVTDAPPPPTASSTPAAPIPPSPRPAPPRVATPTRARPGAAKGHEIHETNPYLTDPGRH